MQIGLIGLGRMGLNLALNMREHGHEVIGFDRSKDALQIAANEGTTTVETLEGLVNSLKGKRVIWIMVPSGAPVEDTINTLIPLLNHQDIIIDGGNSNYKDTLRRYEILKEKGINFVDIGTSGGIEGARNGACTMVGADNDVFEYIETLIKEISCENGYLHTGRSGSGHFVKMIHNGIEYGMMQAIGEGFEILEKSQFDLDYEKIAEVWNHGSVVRSWLMELVERAFSKDPQLDMIKGVVHSSGEGLWTVQEALELKVPIPVIAQSLFVRYRSEQEDTFTGKVVAALRNEFGGHAVEKK